MIIKNKWTTPVIVENITQGTAPATVTSRSEESVAVDIDDEITVTEGSAGVTFRGWLIGDMIPVFRGVECRILEMPPMRRFTTDTAGTTAGEGFFEGFNYQGTVISLPNGSFDISGITKTDYGFFQRFNQSGKLMSLPAGSFDTSNIQVAGIFFFNAFNKQGNLISLPEGSFKLDNVEFGADGGAYFFAAFNAGGKITSLPAGSFNTTNLTKVGTYGFDGFNTNGKITSLPAGSFNTTNIVLVGNKTAFNNFNASTGRIGKSTTSYNPNFINPNDTAKDAHYWNGSSTTTESVQPGDPFYFEFDTPASS